MWWECSECGTNVERPRRPIKCKTCGTAGPVYSPVNPEEIQRPSLDNLRQTWFEVGFSWPQEDAEGLPVAA